MPDRGVKSAKIPSLPETNRLYRVGCLSTIVQQNKLPNFGTDSAPLRLLEIDFERSNKPLDLCVKILKKYTPL